MRKSSHLNDISTVLMRLADNQQAQEKEVARRFALSLVATIWLATSETQNSLQMQQLGIPVLIPRMGVVFAAALFLGLATLRTASSLVIASSIQRVLECVVRVDEPATLSPLYDSAGSFLAPFLKEFRFFLSSRIHDAMRLLVVFSIILVAAGVYFFAVTLLAFEATQFLFFGSSLATFVLAILTFAILVAQVSLQLVLYVPIKFRRNNGYIRWNFLSGSVYKNSHHPQASSWLG